MSSATLATKLLFHHHYTTTDSKLEARLGKKGFPTPSPIASCLEQRKSGFLPLQPSIPQAISTKPQANSIDKDMEALDIGSFVHDGISSKLLLLASLLSAFNDASFLCLLIGPIQAFIFNAFLAPLRTPFHSL